MPAIAGPALASSTRVPNRRSPACPRPSRIGLAGLGTVGGGVVKIVQAHADTLAARAGRPVEIAAISARSRTATAASTSRPTPGRTTRSRSRAGPTSTWSSRRSAARTGRRRRPPRPRSPAASTLVTANKAMLARHGPELAAAAEASGVALRFEAAVAGGIPVVKALTEGLAGNAHHPADGGAERHLQLHPDPDGGRGRALRSRCSPRRSASATPRPTRRSTSAASTRRRSWRCWSPSPSAPASTTTASRVEGIERVSLADIEHAAELGYRIKLLGVAQPTAARPRGPDAALPRPGRLAGRPARGRHQHGGARRRLRRPHRAVRPRRRRGADRLGDRRRRHRHRPRPRHPGLRPARPPRSPRRPAPPPARPPPTTCASCSPTPRAPSPRSPPRSAPPASRSTGCARSSTPAPRRRC